MINSYSTPRRGTAASIVSIIAAIFMVVAAFAVISPAGWASSTVGITRIDHTPSDVEVENMVRQAVALAGGLPVSPGDHVLVKPNLVEAGWPSGGGVVTDVRVIRTVVKMAKEASGPTGLVTIVEGSAGFNGSYSGWNTRDATKKAAYDVGLDTDRDMRDDYDYGNGPDEVMIVDLNDVGGTFPDYPCSPPCSYPGGYVTPITVTSALYPSHNPYYVPNLIAPPPTGADVLISVPTLKNHGQAGYTAACKNRVGTAPNDIYHLSGSVWYKWNLVHAHGGTGQPGTENEAVDCSVADLNMVRPNDFVVVDGLIGIINGPVGSGGIANPKVPNMRLMMASTDSVAIDTVGCLVVGYKPTAIGYLGYLAVRGFGIDDTSLIDVLGTRASQVRSDFPLPYADLTVAERAESTSPTMTDFNPTDGSTLTGIVTVEPVGLSDNVGVAKVEFIIDGVTRSVDRTAPWSYSWDTSGEASGAHTVQVIAYDAALNDVVDTHVVNVGPTLVTSPLLSAGWHQLSVPIQPDDPTPAAVFREPDSTPIPIDGNLWRWDTGTSSYVMYNAAAPGLFGDVGVGVGMWLHLSAAKQISYLGSPAAGPVAIPLDAAGGWHMTGQPHDGTTALTSCTVTDTGVPQTLTFADAVAAHWLSSPMYSWDPPSGSYQRCGLDPWDDTDLDAWAGYWLYVMPGRNLDLTVPKP